MPRTAFPGYDEPVNIDMDPEDALKLILDDPAEDEAMPEAEPEG
jgi:hypothetical protein